MNYTPSQKAIRRAKIQSNFATIKQRIMNKDNSKIYLLVLLGLLTAFGPFVTDMYLPTLTDM